MRMTGNSIVAILICSAIVLFAPGDLKAADDAPDAKKTTSPEKPAPPAERPRGGGPRGPVVNSPEVSTDRHITFRILAPEAQNVRLSAGDIPGGGSVPLKKADNGVWELTLGPIDPGAYRYDFNIDGVSVIDPRSPAVSESNNRVWSVANVPGAAYMDAGHVPHGAVAAVHYYSATLGKDRRMHVYTPPGYEAGQATQEKYPVFYLLHGAGDSDDSWTSVGRANYILDNLIAAGKARPMIVVMPAGHTSSAMFGPPTTRPSNAVAEFDRDFLSEIVPYVEKHYRVLDGRKNRAIAGLSMGGGQSLSIGLPHLEDFSYIGVFSSGIFQRNLADWEKEHQSELDNAAGKDGLKLFWFRTGKDDFLVQTSRNTVDLLKKHGFTVVYDESTGGHTWINWREYLNEFAPQLFR